MFLVVSRRDNPQHALDLGLGIAAFAALGLVHYALIGSRYDRPWLKYIFVTIDIAILSLLMAIQPLFDSVDVPQVMTFRNASFPLYFLILGIAAFSFSPGLEPFPTKWKQFDGAYRRPGSFTPWRRCASLPMRGIAMRSAPIHGVK